MPRTVPWLGTFLEAVFWSGLIALALAARSARGEEPGGAARGEDVVTLETIGQRLRMVAGPLMDWYERTPPLERVSWGGLAACAGLGLTALLGRLWVARRARVLPASFRTRFHARLVEGRLDWTQALDYCELNPCPASRVALAAIRRWGRPAADLERAVAAARLAEVEPLRRHVGTLRRVAALAPLVGLLGTLAQAGRILSELKAGDPLGPPLAAALVPLTVAVGLAILALLAYDGVVGRIDNLSAELDRVGADLVDALAPYADEAAGRTIGQPRVEVATVPPAPHGLRFGRVEPSDPRSPASVEPRHS